jgi:hypothetical protein
MVENFDAAATSLLQCLSKLWHPVEGLVLVNRLGKAVDGRREPRSVDGAWAKRIAEDVLQPDATIWSTRRTQSNSNLKW